MPQKRRDDREQVSEAFFLVASSSSAARSSSGDYDPSAYRAGTAIRFGGTCDNVTPPSRYAPISSTRSSAPWGTGVCLSNG